VLAIDEVRYQGEPVAILAASDPHTARRALSKITVSYVELAPLTDARAAVFDHTLDLVHPEGNVVRYQPIRQGFADSAEADVVVVNEYEVGMQDQAFLGPESGLAVPAADGGVDL
jgi:CO/xanthine dehydrogenase Mo-binding subunit